MKLVNLGTVCIVLAQWLVVIPCKGSETDWYCQQITQQIIQQFTEQLTAMEERFLEALKNQTDAMARIHCPDSWVSFNGSCYLFSRTTATFSSAWVFCKLHGSHLVHVESEQENIFLKTHIMDLQGTFYWIGLTDRYIEGVFFWYDSGVTTSFADWFSGQPDNYQGDEHCVHYYTVDDKVAWNDINCGRSFRFICEK